MATDLLKKRDLLRIRPWRITIKSDDQVTIRHAEPFSGNFNEARKRAWLLWARTSFVVNKRTSNGLNRDVYACLEVWDAETHQYRVVKEKRGRLHHKAPAPADA